MQAGMFRWFCVVLGLSAVWILETRIRAEGVLPSPEAGALEGRFAERIYPLLTRGGAASCVGCHDESTGVDLVFIGDARDDFRMLLSKGYLDVFRADGLLDRLEAVNLKRRMPKGDKATPWSREEIELLRAFAQEVAAASPGESNDEGFPPELLEPYRGEAAKEQADTQFLTWTQLKGKVATIFGDDWVREGVDFFDANVALFGGADFEKRFNESSRATSGYLTALKQMARDVAERAYVSRSGLFAEETFWWLRDADQKLAVRYLYERVLLRAPSEQEIEAAEQLFAEVKAQESNIAARDYDLVFALEVADESTGLRSVKTVKLPVIADGLPVHQQFLNQEIRTDAEETKLARESLDGAFFLRAGVSGQGLAIHTQETDAPVSFAGLLLEHVDGDMAEWIGVRDERVQFEGGWKLSERDGYWSAEEASDAAAGTRIEVPLEPDFDGHYRLSLYWRPSDFAAREVLAEVRHSGKESSIANKLVGAARQDDSVRYVFDGRKDTVPFVEFEPLFRFGDSGYVEINNRGTQRKVAVGPIIFWEPDKKREFEVDTKEAEGFDAWSPFKASAFGAYNHRGTRVEDKNRQKGELFLRYFPKIRSEQGWQQDAFYRLRIYYPGKRDHEPRTPLYVHAEASSPLIQLSKPLRVHAGSRVKLNASASFTTQGSRLRYQWRQLAGVPVKGTMDEESLSFEAPRQNVEFQGWLALTRAILQHPDFLFTRAPALDWVAGEIDRRRLLLSRLALDLVGRTPTKGELRRFLGDWDWKKAVDYYLASEDFQQFYYHRIRLYLESQGTEQQDEPVRLWCYVAFQDRPFQEILTGAYTVDTAMTQRERPGYHGNTGVLTTAGFIEGKPGLPHYNYAAQVSMLFLGYRYEVPAEIVEQREGTTPLGTTDPNSTCYSCHKILTPLAFQRNFWSDAGKFRMHNEYGLPIEASDHNLTADYPFKGEGLEAFALQAARKERFIRTMIDTHFNFLFGRTMRYRTDERALYKQLWDRVHQDGFTIKGLLRALVESPAYIGNEPAVLATKDKQND